MTAPAVVALNTFREAVRDRVLYNLIFFALLMMGAAVLVGQISIGIEREVIVSLGLAAISAIGLVMAVFIGVGLVYKEMDRRTLYALLSKPVRRWEFLLGKFAGLVFTLAVNTALMTVGLLAALAYVAGGGSAADARVLVAVYFILLKLALVTSLALLFSCFSSPLLSIVFTLGIYLAGLFATDLRQLGEVSGSRAVGGVATALSYVLPNFHNFDAIAAAAHGGAISGPLIAQNTAYAAVYCALLLVVSAAVFANRNLK